MSFRFYSPDDGFLALNNLLLELTTLALDIGKSELGPGLRKFGLVTFRESYLPGLVACGESEFDRILLKFTVFWKYKRVAIYTS
jgi:hypothetical protein